MRIRLPIASVLQLRHNDNKGDPVSIKHAVAALNYIALAVIAVGAVALGSLYADRPDGYTIADGTTLNTSNLPHATPLDYGPYKFPYIAGLPRLALQQGGQNSARTATQGHD